MKPDLPRAKVLNNMFVSLDNMPNKTNPFAAHADMASTINKQLGLPDNGPYSVRYANGEYMVGTKKLREVMDMPEATRLDYLGNNTNFGGTDVGSNINTNINATPELSLSKSQPTVININKYNTVQRTSVIENLVKKAIIFIGGVWTIAKLSELAETQSGCFLKSPDGTLSRITGDTNTCTCANGTAAPDARLACCNACKLSNPEITCSDGTDTGYVCPFGGNPAAQRFTLSAASSAALKNAQKSVVASNAALLGACVDGGCVTCGCSEDYQLCCKSQNELGALVSLLGNVGQSIVEEAGDIAIKATDVIGNVAGGFLSKLSGPLKYTLLAIMIAAVIGVAIYLTIRFTKKR